MRLPLLSRSISQIQIAFIHLVKRTPLRKHYVIPFGQEREKAWQPITRLASSQFPFATPSPEPMPYRLAERYALAATAALSGWTRDLCKGPWPFEVACPGGMYYLALRSGTSCCAPALRRRFSSEYQEMASLVALPNGAGGDLIPLGTAAAAATAAHSARRQGSA